METASRSSGGGKQVLVVEDDTDCAEIMCTVLELLGHAGRIAHSGREAIEIACGLTPSLSILDLELPDMSGYTLARWLRACAGMRGSYLIALSGYSGLHHRKQAAEAGFDSFLVKPASISMIEDAIALSDVKRCRRSRPSLCTIDSASPAPRTRCCG
jgi:CheY-like chemotaxis protein